VTIISIAHDQRWERFHGVVVIGVGPSMASRFKKMLRLIQGYELAAGYDLRVTIVEILVGASRFEAEPSKSIPEPQAGN